MNGAIVGGIFAIIAAVIGGMIAAYATIKAARITNNSSSSVKESIKKEVSDYPNSSSYDSGKKQGTVAISSSSESYLITVFSTFWLIVKLILSFIFIWSCVFVSLAEVLHRLVIPNISTSYFYPVIFFLYFTPTLITLLVFIVSLNRKRDKDS